MKLAVRPSGLESSDPHQNPLHGLFVSHLLQDNGSYIASILTNIFNNLFNKHLPNTSYMWRTVINTHAYMHTLTHMHPTVRFKKMKVRCVSICVWYWEIRTLGGNAGGNTKTLKMLPVCLTCYTSCTLLPCLSEKLLNCNPEIKLGVCPWWQIGFWQNFCLWEVWVVFGDK